MCVCVSWGMSKEKDGLFSSHKSSRRGQVCVCQCAISPPRGSAEAVVAKMRHQTTSHPVQHLGPSGAFVLCSVTHGCDGLSVLPPYTHPTLPPASLVMPQWAVVFILFGPPPLFSSKHSPNLGMQLVCRHVSAVWI